jgi:hypothetical protein
MKYLSKEPAVVPMRHRLDDDDFAKGGRTEFHEEISSNGKMAG